MIPRSSGYNHLQLGSIYQTRLLNIEGNNFCLIFGKFYVHPLCFLHLFLNCRENLDFFCSKLGIRIINVQRVYLFFADAKVQTAGLPSSWLAIVKCRRISAVTLLGILKCGRGSADRGWLFISADAKEQTLALSLFISRLCPY